MSEAKFTKGPWEASTDPFDYGLVRCDGVAVARGHSGSNIPYTEKIRANAHLIAAAPEMYEAMQEFVNRVDRGEVRSTATYNKFKTILAKARGKA